MIENLWIIITTVNKPTPAIVEYSRIVASRGWRLLIVGDVKTPNAFHDVPCIFLSLEEQERFCQAFSNLVPVRHYSRKNVGYLYAMANGAEWIFDTDDDNIPLEDFAASLRATRPTTLISGAEFVNVYKYFCEEAVWPRGLPLTALQETGRVVGKAESRLCPVQQFLADKEPDVDAIYRLTSNREILFRRNAPAIRLSPGTWCPFNSQATLFHRRFFRTLYLPCFVPFRMTDIWRSFIAQRLLWASGEGVAFIPPNVVQKRNPHDFFADYKDETLGYLHNADLCGILSRLNSDGEPLGLLLLKCYSAVQASGVITSKETPLLEGWNSLLDGYGIP
jgi:hypothetical protein